MESGYLTLPQDKNYEYGYELAYRLAGEQLAGIDELEQQCLKSGAHYQTTNS